MKTFNHVNDIWEALETCTTVDQIYDILDNIPQKFGTWWADVVGENEIEVTNQWWDKYQEDMVVESQIFEVKLELKKEDEVAEMAKANELFKEDEEEIERETAEKDHKAEALQLLDEIRNMVCGYVDSASVGNPPTQEDLEVLEAKLSELNRKLEAI